MSQDNVKPGTGTVDWAPPAPEPTADPKNDGLPTAIGKYRGVERLGRGGQAEAFRTAWFKAG